MSVRFVIDPLDFVRKAEAHHGRIPLAELERLHDFLYENHGEILYQISGILDQDNKPHLRIKVEGKMQLRCQRCLGGLSHRVDIDTFLLLAKTENELILADADDSADALLATAEMDVLDLIEEEIILSLSISSRHSEGECETHQPEHCNLTESPDLKNPFAVLKALKKTQH